MTQTNKPNTADKLNAALSNRDRQELDQRVDQMYNDLFDNGIPHGTLPERVFVEKFLPFFSGQQKDDPKLQILTHWVGIAGSPMNPVDIVNPAGKVVCTIPPMMTSDFIHKGVPIRGKTFSQIALDARIQSNRIPVMGENILKTAGVNKAKQLTPELDRSEVDQWKQVFERYGVEINKTKTGNGPKLYDNGNESDDLEYE